ncbi:STM3941 family protein [Flavobacterium sp. KACC 22761]|uniref:STM3941 family protein n=1 Tax=Flavobacterium sp. KACC 22761 TaxID=3092665 RepID=UPI002A74F090|nr:STM3941 family protein [Flavobacterium sp. KACC 22761]WPO79761.1 STM3941 family protein [Flavobacterium sp. KACC 22761]
MEKIELFSSKKKSFLHLIGGLLFVFIGVYLFIKSESNISSRSPNPISIKALGIITILFFGLGAFIAIRNLIKERLILIIDENGIDVNPKKNSSGFINWNNIEGFSELKIQNQKMVLIKVNNTDYWIENEKNILKKKLIEFNFENYGSPFCLSAVSMQINHAELMKVLNENLEKYKKFA